MNTIFAVIWNDFIPLSLACINKESAIQTAKNIHARAPDIAFLKGVELTPEDKLITLWQPNNQ